MPKDNYTSFTIFNTLNKLKINYSIGGLSLIDYIEHDMIDKTIRGKTTIYLLDNSIFKLALLTIILFLKGLYIKPEFSSQNRRFKIRKKLFKRFFKYKDNKKYFLYLVKTLNKDYVSIVSGRREVFFKAKDLNKNNLIKKIYKSKAYSNENLHIFIPKNINNFLKKYKSNLLSAQYKYYNTNFYSSEEVEKGVMLLSRVVDIIEDVGIEYWLEGGTCLGAVRDGHFIPWDHDLDLGIKFESEEKIKLLIQQLNSFFKIETRGFNGKHKSQFGEYRLIKISAYKGIFKKVKEQILKNIGYRNDFCLDLFVFYKQPLNGDLNNMVYKYVVFNKVGYHEKKYLDETQKIAFYNREYNIPNNVNSWLATKYGKDWKTPKEEWHVNLDDKTLNVDANRTIE